MPQHIGAVEAGGWSGPKARAYLRVLAERGDSRTGRVLAASSIARRASAVHGLYRYAARHGAVVGSPFTGISHRVVDEEARSAHRPTTRGDPRS